VEVSEEGNHLTFRFDVEEADVENEAKLFAKRASDRLPIVGHTTL
jgi:hypothetical protein